VDQIRNFLDALRASFWTAMLFNTFPDIERFRIKPRSDEILLATGFSRFQPVDTFSRNVERRRRVRFHRLKPVAKEYRRYAAGNEPRP